MLDPALFTQLSGTQLVISAKSASAPFWFSLRDLGITAETQHHLHASRPIEAAQAVRDLDHFVNSNPDPEFGLLVFGTCKGITSPITRALINSRLVDRVWHYELGLTAEACGRTIELAGDAHTPYRSSSLRLAQPLHSGVVRP